MDVVGWHGELLFDDGTRLPLSRPSAHSFEAGRARRTMKRSWQVVENTRVRRCQQIGRVSAFEPRAGFEVDVGAVGSWVGRGCGVAAESDAERSSDRIDGRVVAGKDVTMLNEVHRDEDFSGMKSAYWITGMSTFERCRFDSVRAAVASLGEGPTPTVFRDCSFDGARFTRTMLGLLRFERCTFRNVVMRKWISNDGDFVDCVFSGDFSGLTIAGAGDRVYSSPLTPNEIVGNDFRDVVMWGGGFRAGVDLYKQQLPTDPRHVFIPDPGVTLPAAFAAVRTWDDRDMRISAEATLTVLAQDYRGGQSQLLLCPSVRDPADALLVPLVRNLVKNTA